MQASKQAKKENNLHLEYEMSKCQSGKTKERKKNTPLDTGPGSQTQPNERTSNTCKCVTIQTHTNTYSYQKCYVCNRPSEQFRTNLEENFKNY